MASSISTVVLLNIDSGEGQPLEKLMVARYYQLPTVEEITKPIIKVLNRRHTLTKDGEVTRED
jgi:hypothetical protein